MILRRITEHVKAQNWFAVGLDFLIVVVGVFIGIQVSNWNEARSTVQSERLVLRELHMALSRDVEELNRNLVRYRDLETRINALIIHLDGGKPYDVALDEKFGAVYGVGNIELDHSAYESLKSQGIGLISEATLRSKISQVYERAYGKIESSASIENNVVLEVLRPYYLTRFRDLRFDKSATPLDYGDLQNDPYYRNIVSYRLRVVRDNHVPTFEAALTNVNDLIAAIEHELGSSKPEETP